MLTFDLNQAPPTAEQIAAERLRLEESTLSVKRWAVVGSLTLLALSTGLVSWGWRFKWLTQMRDKPRHFRAGKDSATVPSIS